MPDDDDFLEGCCDLDYDNGPPTRDEDIDWVVLFASVLLEPDEVIEARAAEWRGLFG